MDHDCTYSDFLSELFAHPVILHPQLLDALEISLDLSLLDLLDSFIVAIYNDTASGSSFIYKLLLIYHTLVGCN